MTAPSDESRSSVAAVVMSPPRWRRKRGRWVRPQVTRLRARSTTEPPEPSSAGDGRHQLVLKTVTMRPPATPRGRRPQKAWSRVELAEREQPSARRVRTTLEAEAKSSAVEDHPTAMSDRARKPDPTHEAGCRQPVVARFVSNEVGARGGRDPGSFPRPEDEVGGKGLSHETRPMPPKIHSPAL